MSDKETTVSDTDDRAERDYADAGARLDAARDRPGPDGGVQDEASEDPALHTVTTQGHQLAVTTTEEEAVATVEAYQRAGYPDLDVVTAGADEPMPSWMGGPGPEAHPDEDVETYRGPYSTDAAGSSAHLAENPQIRGLAEQLADAQQQLDDLDPAELGSTHADYLRGNVEMWQERAGDSITDSAERGETSAAVDRAGGAIEAMTSGDADTAAAARDDVLNRWREDDLAAGMGADEPTPEQLADDSRDKDPQLHVHQAILNRDGDYPADAPWASPPPATTPDAEDEVSPGRLDDENRATDWIREHDGEPAEGARPDPDSEFVWKDDALQYDGPRDERDEPTQVDPDGDAGFRLDASEAHPAADRVEGPQSSYFTNEELADVDPNFSYGPAGEPRTRADASSEWVTDPDWDGTDPFVEAYREPTQEVWEQWEKEAQGRTVDTAEAQVDGPADDRDTYAGVSRGKELDDQVARAHDALTQLAADDQPSTDRAPAASTSDDNETRVR